MAIKDDSYETTLAKLEKINRVANLTRTKKLHHSYISKEDRLSNWQFAREDYSEWRKTPEAVAWIKRKREKQLNLCFICRCPLDTLVHIDHIFPLYLGGTSSKGNMCLTHPACNMAKGATVTMTYKEACKRRSWFKHLRTGLRVHKTLRRKPNYQASKTEIKRLELALEYVPELLV